MYSAQDIADILSKNYKDITKRTINYYAFDKKMFNVSGGRNCFTDDELEKIENILLLKEKTSYTLEQIKTIINTKSNGEIKKMFEQEKIRTVIIDPEGEYEAMARKIGGEYIKLASNNSSCYINPFDIEEISQFDGIVDKVFKELAPHINNSYKMSDELYEELNSVANLTNDTKNIIKKYK